MKIICAFLSLCLLFKAENAFAQTQTLELPCDLQARMSFGICIDIPCIPHYIYPEGGTAPFTYQWSNGSTQNPMVIGPPYPDVCQTVTVTDAKGCKAIVGGKSSFVGGWSNDQVAAGQPGFLSPDTVVNAAGTVTFNVSQNDHALANAFRLVQPARHGTVTVNPDGTCQYVRDAGWCGPDCFSYTATDTTQCVVAYSVNVTVLNGPCAGVFVKRNVCDGVCNGEAVFYEQGVLTHPLSYNWSNGATGQTADELCSGAHTLTVTDASGGTHTYSFDVISNTLDVQIMGTDEVCENGKIVFQPVVNNLTPGDSVSYQWSWQTSSTPWNVNVYKEVLSQGAPTFWPSLTTNDTTYQYRLIATSASGCVDTLYHNLKVIPQPYLGYFTYLKPTCPGDTLKIAVDVSEGNGGYTFVWAGPGGIASNEQNLVWPNITGQEDGYFRVTVTDAKGCMFSREMNIALPDSCPFSVLFSPVFAQQPTVFCKGSDIPLDYGIQGITTWPNDPPDRFEWTGPNGFFSENQFVTLENVQPSMSGTYTLKIWYGPHEYSGQVDIVISDVASEVTNVTFNQLPSKCGNQNNDGKAQIAMSSPPPYTVQGAAATNTNSNPFTVSNLNPNTSYQLKIISQGCKVFYDLEVPYPAEPQFDITPVNCEGDDGAIKLISPNPLDVQWWHGPDNFSSGNDSMITGLRAGVYEVRVRDLTTTCIFQKEIVLEPYLDFEVNVVEKPSCTDNSGILEAVELSPAVPPVGYAWSNGFAGNPNENLSYGGYSVTMTDGDGCKRHQNVSLPAEEACVSRISGFVYLNTDCECVYDAGNQAVSWLRVCITGPDGYQDCAYTDYTGYFEVIVTQPGDYTVQAYRNNEYFDDACATANVTIDNVPEQVSGLQLFFCAPPVTDVAVSMCCEAAHPGFEQVIHVSMYNEGTLPVDTAFVTAYIDPKTPIQHISPAPFSFDPLTNQAVWLVRNIPLNGSFHGHIYAEVQAQLGDTVHQQVIVSATEPDVQPNNNISTCERIVTGSFDPNDKLVNPIGAGSEGGISDKDSLLTYLIRFQNTGTDTAFSVVIRDTLDALVYDLNSVQPLMASHPFRLDVEGNRILVFTFDPIHLPDSNRNEPASHGYVLFQIKLLPGLPAGTVIRNSAAIYFDYNYPVITPDAVNTIVKTIDNQEIATQFSIFPNPSDGKANVSIRLQRPAAVLSLELYGPDGRFLKTLYRVNGGQLSDLFLPVDTGQRLPGIYFIRLQTEYGTAVRKIIIFGFN